MLGRVSQANVGSGREAYRPGVGEAWRACVRGERQWAGGEGVAGLHVSSLCCLEELAGLGRGSLPLGL